MIVVAVGALLGVVWIKHMATRHLTDGVDKVPILYEIVNITILELDRT